MSAEDPCYGNSLTDKNGTPINCGDSVEFLGHVEKITRKKWDDPDAGPVIRLQVGTGYWLTPYTASMCEVLNPSNASRDSAAESATPQQ